ncbi:MAG: Ig-like domain-containing protein, partial [Nitrososphaerales archaeon]
APGDSKTCIITNNDNQPTLTIIKKIINDNGGTLAINGVTLKNDGNTVTNATINNVSAGVHTVSEAAIPGYTGIISGDCQPNGSVTLAPGNSKTCIITNNDNQPTLTVIKKIINDSGGTLTVGAITLKIDGNLVTNATSNPVNVGIHTVSETAILGYTATISGDCAADGSITVPLGDSKTCTITNKNKTPTITVIKKIINDNGDTLDIDKVTLQIDNEVVINGTAMNVTAGLHRISEDVQSPFDYIAKFAGDCDSGGYIKIALGQNKVCTIINDDKNTLGNLPPITGADRVTAIKNTPLTINVLENDTDASNDILRIISASQGSNGVTTSNIGFLTSWGVTDSQLRRPVTAAADPFGNVFVVDDQSNR